jgi:hypothetical protein
MNLVLGTFALALVAGYLSGGRLAALGRLRIRWPALAIAGFAMQVVNPPGRWPLAMLLGSFVLLTAFTIANLRTTGFALILVGVALNFTVIAVNGGMPVSRDALVASGQEATLSELTDEADAYVKHHLADGDDRALFLADVIGLPPPVAQAVSVGDVWTYGGIAVVVAAGMRRRPIEPASPAADVPAGATEELERVAS